MSARLWISVELFRDLLCLPEDTQILEARALRAFCEEQPSTIELLISQKDLPPVDYVNVEFETVEEDTPRFVRWLPI